MSIIITSKDTIKWLSEADIFVGDMSDLTYEALVAGIPIFQFENLWIRQNFPVVGERFQTSKELYNKLDGYLNGKKYEATEKDYSDITGQLLISTANSNQLITSWLASTFKLPYVNLAFYHMGSEIYKEALFPIIEELKLKYNEYSELESSNNIKLCNNDYQTNDQISFICHVENTKFINKNDFIIHLGHGLKGDGTAFLETSKNTYLKNNYFPRINKFFVAGEMGRKRLINVLGIADKRIEMLGYAKISQILKERDIKQKAYRNKKKIILYGPAGINERNKPGGSLSLPILFQLFRLGIRSDIQIVIKIKSYRHFFSQIKNLILRK